MSDRRLQQYLSKKKQSTTPAEEDKDFMDEMAQRINAPVDFENEMEHNKKERSDEQESDGSANAFETK